MPEILEKILAIKRVEVAAARLDLPVETLRKKIGGMTPARDFLGAIRSKHDKGEAAVIAEIKRASPSKGVFRSDFNVIEIARSYAENGAACLSVLTDGPFFGGSADDLAAARSACDLPVLRKDFIVDSYQVYEARAMGADCILLIAGAISLPLMRELEQLAFALGLGVLVESHNAAELDQALQLKTHLIGINNRDLKTFGTNLSVTEALKARISADRITVTESGITTQEDVARMKKLGVNTYLIGGVLMQSPDPGKKLKELFF